MGNEIEEGTGNKGRTVGFHGRSSTENEQRERAIIHAFESGRVFQY